MNSNFKSNVTAGVNSQQLEEDRGLSFLLLSGPFLLSDSQGRQNKSPSKVEQRENSSKSRLSEDDLTLLFTPLCQHLCFHSAWALLALACSLSCECVNLCLLMPQAAPAFSFIAAHYPLTLSLLLSSQPLPGPSHPLLSSQSWFRPLEQSVTLLKINI